MKQGYLSQYFNGIAFKYLSAVEIDPKRSNQHEFHGDQNLRILLGDPIDKVRIARRVLSVGSTVTSHVYTSR